MSDTPNAAAFSELEHARYGRHFLLPQVGMDGQRRLKQSRVLIIGAGGLGSPSALYLAGAGVGTLGLVDFDTVDVTNLHRQLLHGTGDVGRSKLESARDRLHEVNPHVALELYETRLTSANALDILREYDVVLDGTDNFATRYLVNDACVLLGKPNVYGSIFRFEGQASLFSTPDGPCYRCLYPEPPPPGSVPSCAEGGVLGVLPGLVGTIQATEAIKLCLGIGTTLAGRLLLIDTLGMEFRTVRISRDPSCAMCGTRTITELIDYDAFCGMPAPDAVRIVAPGATGAPGDVVPDIVQLTPGEVMAKRRRGERFDLLDVRELDEWEAGHVDGAELVPLGTLATVLATRDREREIVVMCQSGGRSARAAQQLHDAGFSHVANMVGGMLRWRDEVG